MTEQEICCFFGKNIRKLRNRNNWSQEALAEKLNISISFLSNIENGKAWISPKTIARLCDIFGVDVYEFFIQESFLPKIIEKEVDKTVASHTEIFRKNLEALIRQSLTELLKS